jgi:hypothetical protein
MIILESLSKLENISLEELDLTVYFIYLFISILIFFYLGFNIKLQTNI